LYSLLDHGKRPLRHVFRDSACHGAEKHQAESIDTRSHIASRLFLLALQMLQLNNHDLETLQPAHRKQPPELEM
jgi:hypothetical protein